MEIMRILIEDEVDQIAEELERLGRKGLPWYGSQYEINHLRQSAEEIRRLKQKNEEAVEACKMALAGDVGWSNACHGVAVASTNKT